MMAMVTMIGFMSMVAMIGVMAMIAMVAIKSLSSEGRSLPSPRGRGEYFIHIYMSVCGMFIHLMCLCVWVPHAAF